MNKACQTSDGLFNIKNQVIEIGCLDDTATCSVKVNKLLPLKNPRFSLHLNNDI